MFLLVFHLLSFCLNSLSSGSIAEDIPFGVLLRLLVPPAPAAAAAAAAAAAPAPAPAPHPPPQPTPLLDRHPPLPLLVLVQVQLLRLLLGPLKEANWARTSLTFCGRKHNTLPG